MLEKNTPANHRLYTGLLLVLLLTGAGCKNRSLEDTPGERIVFEPQVFSRTLDQCQIDGTPCAQVEAEYPRATAGPPEACAKINDTLFFHVRFNLALFAATIEEIPLDLNAVADQFFTEYRSMQSYQPDYFIPWRVATAGKVLFQSPKVVSVQLDNYAFAGGAHPNTQTTLLKFDNSTGEILRIDDLIENRSALEELVEASFKKANRIDTGTSVKQSGYFWGESFHLPENFAVLENGLYFFYNPYEVAAYAAGSTAFTVPYEELEGVLKMDRIF